MENILGLLKIEILRGINLAKRDLSSSDPYVVVRLGNQKLKTRVVRKSLSPVWNEELTLTIADPHQRIKLQVYDKDTFSRDDKMGDAEFSIKEFLESQKMNLENIPSGTVITKVKPSRENSLSEESPIIWEDGKVVQQMFLRLRNVECGEIEIQLSWFDTAEVIWAKCNGPEIEARSQKMSCRRHEKCVLTACCMSTSSAVHIEWSLIASRISGQAANDVKNFWNTHIEKKLATVGSYKSSSDKNVWVQISLVKPQPWNFTNLQTPASLK